MQELNHHIQTNVNKCNYNLSSNFPVANVELF